MRHEKFHFIGIGGIGMSALARILAERRCVVSGSDVTRSPVIDELEKKEVRFFLGHHQDHVQEGMTVIYSTAVGDANPEFQAALQRKLPLLHRSDLLLRLMQEKAPLLVTGTHGKTTTASLLAHLLLEAGYSPAFAVGGIVRSIGTNGGDGRGAYFVAEADESDGSFLKYPSYGAILTNIDHDHMDYWKSASALLEGFRQFASQVSSPKHLFWCADDEKLSSLGLQGISYGFAKEADLCIENYRQEGWNNLFDLSFCGRAYTEILIPLIGGHNVLNASAVFGLALSIGVPEGAIRRAFATFKGVDRRAEKKGSLGTIEIYDDYAHHPTEICATLRAMRQATSGKRLVVVFQPHRYTRTRDCLSDYPAAFDHADELILTDIYSAGEPPIEGVTTEALVKKISSSSAAKVSYVPRSDLAPFLHSFLRSDDALITMGAGDVTKVGPEILARKSG